MKKYLIIIGVCVLALIIFLVGLGKYSYLDTEYLFGWGRFKPFPEEIRQKHSATIDKVDEIIVKEKIDQVTSRSEKFNLENYLGIIMTGVLTHLNNKNSNDPIMTDIELLAEDIDKYIKENNRKKY